MTTLSVSSTDLAALLRDVKQAASTDEHLPMMAGVLLHTARTEDGDTVLVATATDRYCLLQGHARVESGELPGPVWVRHGQLSQLAAVLRPFTSRRRAGTAQTEGSVADGKVTVRQAVLDDLANVSVSFEHDPGEGFPDVLKVLSAALEAGPADQSFSVEGSRLALVARIATQRGVTMRVRSSGANRSVVVQIGGNLVGLVMPVRVSNTDSRPVPVFTVEVPAEAVAA